MVQNNNLNKYGGWKQPTPTDINSNPNLTILDKCVFREILSYCRNDDGIENFIHANKNYSVELKRGQCIFKIKNFADGLKISRKAVTKSLQKLSKWYTEMDIKGMPFGCVITMKDYDEIINLDNERDNKGTIKGQWRDNKGTPNKSVKSVKSDKEYFIQKADKEKIEKIRQYYLNKEYKISEDYLIIKFDAVCIWLQKQYDDLLSSGNGKKAEKLKSKNVYMILRQFVNNDIEQGKIKKQRKIKSTDLKDGEWFSFDELDIPEEGFTISGMDKSDE